MDYIRAPPFKSAQNLLFTVVINSRVSELFRLIEDKEVDLNGQNINGSTALHAACMHKLDDVVKVLLDAGAEAFENAQQEKLVEDTQVDSFLINRSGEGKLCNKLIN